MSGASKNAGSCVSELVKRALRREQVERRFDIVSNTAVAELMDLGPEALQEIETSLLNQLSSTDEADARTQFPGLIGVLTAYFDMARRHDVRFADKLLRFLRPDLQVDGLIAIWSIGLGRSKMGPIPEILLRSIQALAAGGAAETSEKAKALLAAYSTLGPRRHIARA